MTPKSLVTSVWFIGLLHVLLTPVPADPIRVCTLVSQRVADGIITPEFAEAIQELVDTGPDRWVGVKGAHVEGLYFQRGVAGLSVYAPKGTKVSPLKSGAEDAMMVFLGEPNPQELHSSVMPNLKSSDEYMNGANSSYSFPLAIRGDAAKVGLAKLTEPTNKSSETIPAKALTADAVHSMGFFYNLAEMKDADKYKWASNYLTLMDKLKVAGVKPTPGSRGDQFHQDLQSVWSDRSWNYTYQEGFGLRELRNKENIISSIDLILKRYAPIPAKKKRPKT